MITTSTRKKIFSAILYAACVLPLVAFAAPPVGEHGRTTVSYRDLDISSIEGMKSLDQRLYRAAKQVCGSSDFRKVGWAVARRNRQCINQAVAKAQAKVHTSRSVAIAALAR